MRPRNAALALRSAPEVKSAFRFDELQRLVIVDKPLPLADGAEPRNTKLAPIIEASADAAPSAIRLGS